MIISRVDEGTGLVEYASGIVEWMLGMQGRHKLPLPLRKKKGQVSRVIVISFFRLSDCPHSSW